MFIGYLAVGVALTFDPAGEPIVAWEQVRLACSELVGQAGWVIPTCLALILSAYASVYAIGVAADGPAERRERDIAVHCAQVVAGFSIVFAFGVCVGIHDLTAGLAPAILVVVASFGCVSLAAVLTRFYVGDVPGRIAAMEKLISVRSGQREQLAGYATTAGREMVKAFAWSVGVPVTASVGLVNLIDQPIAGRVHATMSVVLAVLITSVLAVVSMWPVADDGWGRGWLLVQHLVMSSVALSVPVTIAVFLAPLLTETALSSAIPMWAKAAIDLGAIAAILIFASVAISGIVPWHLTRFRRFAPLTLWGVAARLGIRSLNRSIRSLEDDVAAAGGEPPRESLPARTG